MPNRRILNLSCNENEFSKAKPLYESALKNSVFSYNMKFEAPFENTRRNRNKKVIWFNLPYNLDVKTNIGKIFLNLVNTIKISYSSIPYVKNLIKQLNSNILSNNQDKIQRPCNFRMKESYPLNTKQK